MPHARIPSEEIGRRGKELYETKIRPIVETDENIGKLISINIETGDYAIGDDLLAMRTRFSQNIPTRRFMGNASAMTQCMRLAVQYQGRQSDHRQNGWFARQR